MAVVTPEEPRANSNAPNVLLDQRTCLVYAENPHGVGSPTEVCEDCQHIATSSTSPIVRSSFVSVGEYYV
ncbi:MAG: hypothetical protein NTU41_12800 [Chloroflexi bacterium]|nr:hypothetical protein [Chloroflexota bacterium]